MHTVQDQYAPLIEGTVELIIKCYAAVHYAKLLDSAAQVSICIDLHTRHIYVRIKAERSMVCAVISMDCTNNVTPCTLHLGLVRLISTVECVGCDVYFSDN